jgi:hypothetical protein
MSLLPTVWDDIDHGADFMFVNADYQVGSLTNIMFKMITNPAVKRAIFKTNQHPGLYSDLDKIRAHAVTLTDNPKITGLISHLFPAEHRGSITPLDRVYLNSCYRKLLRAHIEVKYLTEELPNGLIIMGAEHVTSDRALVGCLRLLRIICKFLGLHSTTQPGSFPKSKLAEHSLWHSLSVKFIPLMGEDLIPPIEKEIKPLTPSSDLGAMLEEKDLLIHTKAYMFLNIVFMAWSGSILKAQGEMVHLEPAVYVTRMLPKLTPL